MSELDRTVPDASTPASRGAARRERTSAAALDAVEELLSGRSAEEIRIEDVALAAGLSPGSIYGHFKTKEGLLAAAVDRLLALAAHAIAATDKPEASPTERFQAIGVAYLRLLLDHPALTRYLAARGEWAPRSEFERSVDLRIARLRSEFESRIADALGDVGVAGIDARLMSYFLLGAWNGAAALAQRRDALALPAHEVEAAVFQAGQALVAGMGLSPGGVR